MMDPIKTALLLLQQKAPIIGHFTSTHRALLAKTSISIIVKRY